MLKSLTIRNIVLIESLDIDLESGLCVLTGETGAGKSILLDALGFVLGARGNSRLLRQGAKQALVAGTFDISKHSLLMPLLDEQGIVYEDELVLRRTLTEDGKNKAYINDIPVSIQLLKQVGELLVEVHGQHEQRGLLEAKYHRHLLDAFGELGQGLSDTYQAWQQAAQELAAKKEAQEQALREEEYLQHVSDELQQLAPEAGEEEILVQKRTLMMQHEKHLAILDEVVQSLTGGQAVEESIRSAQRILMRRSDDSPAFEGIIDTLERASIEVNDALEALQHLQHELDPDEQTLEQVEERLFALKAAARKYRVSVDELAGYHQEVTDKLALISGQGQQLADLEKAVADAKGHYIKQADILSKSRKKAASELEKQVLEGLEPLKMGQTEFVVEIETLPEEQWSAFGKDKVQFIASTNPGSPLASLVKIASGGELSRFMLALKVVLAKVKSVPTLIFDEVDTGIGGAVADAVGKKLRALGKHHQVLVVTHQPQVAAQGQYHLKIEKHQAENTTHTTVAVLEQQERKQEIARMLSGEEVTEEARAAAERLVSSV